MPSTKIQHCAADCIIPNAKEPAQVRPATRNDIDVLIPLLDDGFKPPFSRHLWKNLFAYPDIHRAPNLGFVLESKGRVAGFLGGIYSERLIKGRIEKLCNLTSWYVAPEFRSMSMTLLAALLRQPQYTFVILTPCELVTHIIIRYGFRPLETQKFLYCPPDILSLLETTRATPRKHGRLHEARRIGKEIAATLLMKIRDLARSQLPAQVNTGGGYFCAGPDSVRPILSKHDRQVLDDHPRCGHFAVANRSSYSYVVTAKRKISVGRSSFPELIVSDVLYLSSINAPVDSWDQFCKFVSVHDKSHVIAVDKRFLNSLPGRPQIPCYSYFLSQTGLQAQELDNLYTEMALLDLPIYL